MRLFVALVPPAEVVAALPAPPRGLRPVPPGQHHVTLAFLGEVPEPAPVAVALDAVLPGCPAPRLALTGAGVFGHAVWLGLTGERDRLHALAAAVQDAVRGAGVVLEARPYRPHLTVGRGVLPPRLAGYAGPSATWSRVALVRSTLGPAGARHDALRSWRLGGGSAPAASAGW